MLILFLLTSISASLYARDLTSHFEKTYQSSKPLSESEIDSLKNFDFYLVPGILSESFIQDDHRSVLDFAILTKEYFSVQKKVLNSLGLKAKRLPTSSFSVEETKSSIRNAIFASKENGRKAFFITHSLGGLALLEELLARDDLEMIAGIIFLQSPFSGAPTADIYLNYPFQVDKWLTPVLPFFNTSEETLRYLSTRERRLFMMRETQKIHSLVKRVPVLSVGGVANGHRSLFRPSLDLIEFGCVKSFFGKCLTKKLFMGPYDVSDGMVPLESSKLLDADHIVLKGVDHGETVVNIPFESINKKKLTISLFKVFLSKDK